MLVLSRKIDEKIQVGDDITITVVRVSGNRVTIGIDAPHDMTITRAELLNNVAVRDSSEERPSSTRGNSTLPVSPCR